MSTDMIISLTSFFVAVTACLYSLSIHKRYKELCDAHYGDEFTKGCYREIRFATELAAQWHDKYEALAKEKK